MTFVNSVIQPGDPATMAQTAFERELALMIVEALQLEVDPASIVPVEPLFVEGLGLDSIDALEIALAISKRYGMEFKSDDSRREEIFASLRSLSASVAASRTR